VDAASALNDALARLRRVTKPGSVVFIASDFRGYDDATAAALGGFGAHADLALILIHDPLEARFPALAEAASITDGQRVVRLAEISAAERERYAARFAERLATLRKFCRERRVSFAVIDTEADPATALRRLLGS
jgi:hypothetical protein